MNAIISAELVYRLGWTLLHSLWIGAAVALALAAVLALMDRRSAVARYGVAMGAMMMLIAGIGVAFAIVKAPAPPVAQSAAAASARPIAPTGVVVPSEPISDIDRHIQRQTWNGAERIRPEVEPAAQAAAGEGHWLRPALPWIAGGWAAGVVLLSLWQLGGWVAVQRLKVIGVEAVGREVEMMGRRLAERLGLSAAIRVAQSMRVETPLLIGWIRPVVLMPAAVLSGLSPRQLEAILAHELAHIRRHDYLINLLQVVAETLLFYHPAVWWISRRIRLEREQCCDDVAVGVCGDRHCYVESLAALEELRLAGAVALGARGTGESQLMVRIRRLLDVSTHSRRGAHSIAACAISVVLGIALIIGVFGKLASGGQPTTQPTAAELVRGVRASESWVHDVDSLWMRFEGKWTHFPEGIAKRREELPLAMRKVQGEPGLQPAMAETLEIAFDRHRLRCMNNWQGAYEHVGVWDGTRATKYSSWVSDKRDEGAFEKTPSSIGQFMLPNLSWLRTQMHRFWWDTPDESRNVEASDFYGKPEDYDLIGREKYRGIDCYVLQRRGGSFERWYVGVQDRLLHGMLTGTMSDGQRELEVAMAIAAEHGKGLKTREEFAEWIQTLDKPAQAKVKQDFAQRVVRPAFEHWLLDYREVSPGRLFPMRQGYAIFGSHKGKYFADTQRELKAVDVKVNAKLPDELFRFEMKEGVQVWDYTHEPYLTYKYKKSFTPQEWQAILDEAANREWKNTLDRLDARERERLIEKGKGVPAKAPRPATTEPATRPAYRSPIEAYEAQQKAELDAAMGRTLQKIDLSNTTFKEALGRFEKESGIRVTVDWRGLEAMRITPDRPINLKLQADVTAGQVLDAIVAQAARAPGQIEHRMGGGGVVVGPPGPGVAEILKTPLPAPVVVDFSKGIGLRDALDFFRDVTGIRIQTDWDAIRAAGIDDFSQVTFRAQGVSAGQILDRILQDAGGGKLAYRISDIRGDILFVSTKQALPSTQPATQVSIEMRFITVDREVWQKLGVEMKLDVPAAEKGGRGMKGALLDEKAMAKIIRSTQSERSSSIISAPRLTVFNGQIGSILIGGDGPDNEAISIKARPVVSEDRKSIKLTLDAKLSGLAEAKEAGEKPGRQVRELHVLPSIPDGQTLAMVMGPDLEVEIEKAGGGVEKRRQVLVAFVKPTAIIAREPEQEQKKFPLLGR